MGGMHCQYTSNRVHLWEAILSRVLPGQSTFEQVRPCIARSVVERFKPSIAHQRKGPLTCGNASQGPSIFPRRAIHVRSLRSRFGREDALGTRQMATRRRARGVWLLPAQPGWGGADRDNGCRSLPGFGAPDPIRASTAATSREFMSRILSRPRCVVRTLRAPAVPAIELPSSPNCVEHPKTLREALRLLRGRVAARGLG